MKKITLGFMMVFTFAFIAGAISISPTQARAEDLACTIETSDGRILEGTWINGVCQPNSAMVASADLAINTQPVGFFERLQLVFTFNAEKKAQMLQNFSNRSFALAQKKLAEGKTVEASVFFKKSENYTLKANVAASKIKDEEKRNATEQRMSVTASNRTAALTVAKANVENPTAKEAIQNAIDRQIEVDASVKGGAIVTPPVISGNIGASVCNSNSPSTIKVLSPNGGEVYQAGQQITVKWKSCNVTPGSIGIILIKHDSSVAYTQNEGSGDYAGFSLGGFDPSAGTADDGVQQVTLPVSSNTYLTSGQHYFISVTGLGDATHIGSGYTPGDYSDALFTIN